MTNTPAPEAGGCERQYLERVADLSERWKDSLVSQINEIAREGLAACPKKPDALIEALAAYDEACKGCPVNHPKSGQKFQDTCSVYRATPSGSCGVEGGASYDLVKRIREIVKEEGNGD